MQSSFAHELEQAEAERDAARRLDRVMFGSATLAALLPNALRHAQGGRTYLLEVCELEGCARTDPERALRDLTQLLEADPQSWSDLKSVRRTFASRWHPDRFSTPEERAVATRIMQCANELIDRAARSANLHQRS